MPETTSAQKVPWRITAAGEKTHTEEKLEDKFVRKQGLNAGHHKAMELEHVMSQAAQDLNDGETRHGSREAQAHEHEYLHQFIKKRLVSSTARRCA